MDLKTKNRIITKALSVDFVKGGRDYLHGTDIYNAIQHLILTDLKIEDIDKHIISFKSFARELCNILYSTDFALIEKVPDVLCEWKVICKDTSIYGVITSRNKPITYSKEYDEGSVLKFCQIKNKRLVFEGDLNLSLIEKVIAATKHLHLTKIKKNKWAFVRYEGEIFLSFEDQNKFELEIIENLSNRFTKTVLTINSQVVGIVYFSTVV